MSKRITDEDIEKGVEKVEKMNALFDKMVLPVLLIAALAVFFFGALPKLKRCVSDETVQPQETAVVTQSDVSGSDGQEEPNELYARRNAFLSDMKAHREEIEAKGYTFIEAVEGLDSIRIRPDEDTTIYEFCDNGKCYGQIRTTEFEVFEEAAVTVMGSSHINVVLTLADGEKLYAVFENESFLPEGSDDDQQMILAYLTSEELTGIKQRYDRQLEELLG